MEKVGERNGEEVKGTTATKAIAFDQLEFFNQTLELFLPGPRLSLLSPDSGYPCCSKLYYSPAQLGQMEKILMVAARGRETSSVSGTQDLQGCLFSTVFHPVGVQLDIEGFPALTSCCSYQAARGCLCLTASPPHPSSCSAGDLGTPWDGEEPLLLPLPSDPAGGSGSFGGLVCSAALSMFSWPCPHCQ